MPRRRVLPAHVTAVVDRHGKERFRFRRGALDFYIAPPGSKEHPEQYKRAMEGFRPVKSTVKPRSVEDLLQRFYRSAKFIRPGEGWQATIRSVLEPFREEFRDERVADFTFEHIEVILAKRAKKDGKRGGTFAVVRLHEQLTRVFELAIKLGWIDRNPAKEAETPVIHVTKGFHSWREDEISAFQRRHPVGTTARLALEIALWTGLRRQDVVQLGPRHYRDGRIVTVASKTLKAVDVVATDDLREALAETPTGDETFLVTSFGKPFSVKGFGGWFKDRCIEAGLPHCSIHGLRKAMTRRAADLRLSQPMLKALGQWSSDSEVAIYAADADQKALADAAILAVNKAYTLSNRPETVDK